jgi:hypothetical protein
MNSDFICLSKQYDHMSELYSYEITRLYEVGYQLYHFSTWLRNNLDMNL